jgi:5-methylcytosine-specific restriction protein A
MPTAPMRPCAQPGCPTLVAKGRCSAHRLAYERQRGSPSARGYDHAWLKLRAQVLREEEYCQGCGRWRDDRDHVDHIVPLSQGGTNDRENLQRLCLSCHSRKTMGENRSARRR